MHKNRLLIAGILLCLGIGFSGLHFGADPAGKLSCSPAADQDSGGAKVCTLKESCCPGQQPEADEAPRKLRPSSMVKLARYESN